MGIKSNKTKKLLVPLAITLEYRLKWLSFLNQGFIRNLKITLCNNIAIFAVTSCNIICYCDTFIYVIYGCV